MEDLDFEKANAIKLDEDAFDYAVEAATAAHVAGWEPYQQLERAIKVYVLVEQQKVMGERAW